MFRAIGNLVRGAVTACLLCVLVAAQAVAGEMMPVNAGPDKVAIKGYDTVAYFTEGRPTMGLEEFSHEWQGAEWRFASPEHRDLFAADPEKYAPRFGGFCAMGMSLGAQAQIDPEAWAIVGDKLYLTHSPSALAKFTVDTPGHIAKAESVWEDWEATVQGN
ncbi:MAG TPA: YHS domain-containing (seleno)protein [Aestuariivirgaceae bacterium]|nr:YHS domain-containing (seleno)protein [Aestuariivirgaceae bacterium]